MISSNATEATINFFLRRLREHTAVCKTIGTFCKLRLVHFLFAHRWTKQVELPFGVPTGAAIGMHGIALVLPFLSPNQYCRPPKYIIHCNEVIKWILCRCATTGGRNTVHNQPQAAPGEYSIWRPHLFVPAKTKHKTDRSWFHKCTYHFANGCNPTVVPKLLGRA